MILIFRSWICFPLGEKDFEKGTNPMSRSACQRLRKKLAVAILDRHDIIDLETTAWYAAVGVQEARVRLMLRSVCKYRRHYPKVRPSDAWINNFEPNIHSKFVQANMDIQALLSPDLTVKYLTYYSLKGEPSREVEALSDKRLPSTETGDKEALSFEVSIVLC